MLALLFQTGNTTYVSDLSAGMKPVTQVGVIMDEVAFANDALTREPVVVAHWLEQLDEPQDGCRQGMVTEPFLKRLACVHESMGQRSASGLLSEPVLPVAEKSAPDPLVGDAKPERPSAFSSLEPPNQPFIAALSSMLLWILRTSAIKRLPNSSGEKPATSEELKSQAWLLGFLYPVVDSPKGLIEVGGAYRLSEKGKFRPSQTRIASCCHRLSSSHSLPL